MNYFLQGSSLGGLGPIQFFPFFCFLFSIIIVKCAENAISWDKEKTSQESSGSVLVLSRNRMSFSGLAQHVMFSLEYKTQGRLLSGFPELKCKWGHTDESPPALCSFLRAGSLAPLNPRFILSLAAYWWIIKVLHLICISILKGLVQVVEMSTQYAVTWGAIRCTVNLLGTFFSINHSFRTYFDNNIVAPVLYIYTLHFH